MFIWREHNGQFYGSDGLAMHRVVAGVKAPFIVFSPGRIISAKTLEEAKKAAEWEAEHNPSAGALTPDILINWIRDNWGFRGNDPHTPTVCKSCGQLVHPKPGIY